jgi:hypothetical protein
MGPPRQSGLYRLLKRLSLGRHFALWARYLLRRGQSALSTKLRRGPPSGVEAQAAAPADADLATAKRITVASWFPLDLANARLHRALFTSVNSARDDLKLTPEILDCIATRGPHALYRRRQYAPRGPASMPSASSPRSIAARASRRGAC